MPDSRFVLIFEAVFLYPYIISSEYLLNLYLYLSLMDLRTLNQYLYSIYNAILYRM
jgi:hypothetical protein